MRNVPTVALHTIQDELHYRSFYVLLGMGLLVVFLLGGCYKGNFEINGASIGPSEIVQTIASGVYQFFAMGGLLLAALLSARAIRNDRDGGTLAFVLAKPVARWEYLSGKILGLFGLCFLFMFTLQAALFASVLGFSPAHTPMPGILTAALVASLTMLFTICLVLLLSASMPDFICIITAAGVVVLGYLAGPIHGLLSQFARAETMTVKGVKILCIVWPKVGSLQSMAGSLIDGKYVQTLGPVHPAINLGLYTVALIAVLLWRFDRQEL